MPSVASMPESQALKHLHELAVFSVAVTFFWLLGSGMPANTSHMAD
jgi:hypothetical protein